MVVLIGYVMGAKVRGVWVSPDQGEAEKVLSVEIRKVYFIPKGTVANENEPILKKVQSLRHYFEAAEKVREEEDRRRCHPNTLPKGATIFVGYLNNESGS